MFRSRSNCTVIDELPGKLVELMEVTPAIVANCFSSGSATAEAIVSGLAPGRPALTWIVGKSTFGKSLTGSWRYAITPKRRMAIMINVVMTGRRMKISEMFMLWMADGGWRMAEAVFVSAIRHLPSAI